MRVAFFSLAAVFIAFLFLQSVFLPQVVVRFVEKALDLKVSGRIQPVRGKFEFSISSLNTEWDQKIKINSGQISVHYGIKNFNPYEWHIRITGRNVDAELRGDWVSIAGGESALFSDFYADLMFDQNGIKEIMALRAESPTIQFRFGEASKRNLKESHEA